MYLYNKRVRRKRNVLLLLPGIIILGGLLFGAWWVIRDIRKPTVVKQAESTTISQTPTSEQLIPINEQNFTFYLPNDWKQVKKINTPTMVRWTWQATTKGADNRVLDLYVDTVPPDFPINRLLPTSPQRDHFLTGNMSDDCANFTEGDKTSNGVRPVKPVPARWQGINFLCDLPNFINNATGIGSAGALNTVKLTGDKSGTHNYFFVYTDHNIHPDENIFLDAMQSFKVL